MELELKDSIGNVRRPFGLLVIARLTLQEGKSMTCDLTREKVYGKHVITTNTAEASTKFPLVCVFDNCFANYHESHRHCVVKNVIKSPTNTVQTAKNVDFSSQERMKVSNLQFNINCIKFREFRLTQAWIKAHVDDEDFNEYLCIQRET